MVVAVAVMCMVQVPIDQVIGVIPMRYGFVATVGAMGVVRPVPLAGVPLGTVRRVGAGNRKPMFIDVAFVLVV